MKELKNTVRECCPKDCVYRSTFGSDTPYCNYIGVMEHSRGCEVRDCDKYTKGTKKRKNEWTSSEYEGFAAYDLEVDGKKIEKPGRRKDRKNKIKDTRFGRTSTYAEEQKQKTLALIPKIKTTL